MATRVMNGSDIVKEVKIRDEKGNLDSINLMPRSKATLPDGWVVDSVYASIHKASLKIVSV